MTLPVDPAGRKGIPINSGVLRFFPATIAGVARVSVAGSKQHGNASLYDDRSKSNDDLDALQRHLADSEVGDGMDRGPYGTDDPVPHVDKAAWRALRHAQKWHEARGAPVAPAAVLPPAGVVDHALAAAYLRDVAERDDDAPIESCKISGFGFAGPARDPISPDQTLQFYEQHPFQDPDALIGNVTSPAGAQSGGVVDTTREAYVPNPPCAISGDPS